MRHAGLAVLVLASASAAQPVSLPLAAAPTGHAAAFFFDLTSLTSDPYFISHLCLRIDAPAGTQVTLTAWTRPGTHAGNTASSIGWTGGVTSFTVPAAGPSAQTCFTVQFSDPFILIPASQTTGVMLMLASQASAIGFSSVPPAAASYANATLRLDAGPAADAPGFGAAVLEPVAPLAGVLTYYAYEACPAYANCDQSRIKPALNVNDFICFNEVYAAGCFGTGPCRANCDESTTPPILNVLDFICFLNKFALGCAGP
ncbi:MAG: hypothetical protein JNM80_01540 [Phycisphaerae bacterium]|nr:hypothetical protein [Phycisphaerae bacterium]